MELKNIEKKVVANWILARTFWVIVFYAITHLYVAYADIPEKGLWVAILVVIALVDAMIVANAWILPVLQYKKYHYTIENDQIYIENGVIFKQSTVLPIVQLQDVGYTQGPIQTLLGLATLHVSTAGSDLIVDGLKKEDALTVVDLLNQRAKSLIVAKKQEENA